MQSVRGIRMGHVRLHWTPCAWYSCVVRIWFDGTGGALIHLTIEAHIVATNECRRCTHEGRATDVALFIHVRIMGHDTACSVFGFDCRPVMDKFAIISHRAPPTRSNEMSAGIFLLTKVSPSKTASESRNNAIRHGEKRGPLVDDGCLLGISSRQLDRQ